MDEATNARQLSICARIAGVAAGVLAAVGMGSGYSFTWAHAVTAGFYGVIVCILTAMAVISAGVTFAWYVNRPQETERGRRVDAGWWRLGGRNYWSISFRSSSLDDLQPIVQKESILIRIWKEPCMKDWMYFVPGPFVVWPFYKYVCRPNGTRWKDLDPVWFPLIISIAWPCTLLIALLYWKWPLQKLRATSQRWPERISMSETVTARYKDRYNTPRGTIESFNKFAYRKLKDHPSIDGIELWGDRFLVRLKPGVEKTPELLKELRKKLGWMLRSSYILS
jgi:uncharacterized membrane protein